MKIELGKQRANVQPGDSFTPELTKFADAMFAGENVGQMVLHAHLLIERALTTKIAEKMLRPEVFTGESSRWTFASLVKLYIGLFNPDKDVEAMLKEMNALRNKIAHSLCNEDDAVLRTLVNINQGKPPTQTPLYQVKTYAFVLLSELGAMTGLISDPKITFEPGEED